jgi:hypothetical protein
LLQKNSYISFETVLKKEAIIFQHYGDTLFLASERSETKLVNGMTFEYHKLKESLLFNPL